MKYVTFDATGKLTGAYWQDLLPEHQSAYFEVDDAQYEAWTSYQMNEARDAIEARVVVFDLAAAKAALIIQIDADVDAIIGAVIGNRATEYLAAEADAQAFKDGGYTGTAPDSVQVWATVKGQAATWAADDILATATAWKAAQAAIRANRLARKEDARVAADDTALATSASQWSAFVTAIRSQLGLA